MAEKSLPKLKVERAFKNLIRPLRRQEYVRLENSIIANGCKEPIYVWGEYIIDGHSRYEICHKHGIPFETEEIAFESKEEVIIWICKRQLRRKTKELKELVATELFILYDEYLTILSWEQFGAEIQKLMKRKNELQSHLSYESVYGKRWYKDSEGYEFYRGHT